MVGRQTYFLAGTFACAMVLASPAHALRVSVIVNGSSPGSILISQGATNNNEPGITSIEYGVLAQPGVEGSNPPLFYLYQLEGSADSKYGTLRSLAAISNTGGAFTGADGDVTSTVRENFQIRPGEVTGGILGTANVGTSGDGFVTIRARAALDGFSSAGSPTGVPSGASPGVAYGSLFLGMGQFNGTYDSTLWGKFTKEDSSASGERTSTGFNNGRAIFDRGPLNNQPPVQIGSYQVNAAGGSVEMNIDEAWVEANKTFNGNNTFFTVLQYLKAEARVGDFAGAQAVADYSNTGYFDLEIEAGYSLKTNSTNFVDTAQLDAFIAGSQSTGQVSAPGTLGLIFASGLLYFSARRCSAGATVRQ